MKVKHLPKKEMERMIWAAEIGKAPSIDLHGSSANIAISDLDRFLHQEMMDGTRVVKIIHGSGYGKLRVTVHDWLKKQEGLVLYYRDSNAPHEHGSVTFALLEEI